MNSMKQKKLFKSDFVKVSLLFFFSFCFYFSSGRSEESFQVSVKEKEARESGENTQDVESSHQLKFSEANPEDITNENFPDIIESFDYPNTTVENMIKAISKLTKKNFLIDSGVGGRKISILAPSPVTVAEAYKAFLSALAMNGLTVVPTLDGKFLKVRKTSLAMKDSIETYDGNYFPHIDQLVTYILKLKYINTKDVIKDLNSLKSGEGKIIEHAATNSLIITDYGSNIERVRLILKKLDVPGFDEKLEVIRIFYASAEEIANLMNRVFLKGGSSRNSKRRFSSSRSRQKGDKTEASTSFSLITADKRTNTVIALATPAGLRRIKNLIRKLDVEVDPESEGVFVYYVRYGVAEDIASILKGLISSEDNKSSQDRTPSKAYFDDRSSSEWGRRRRKDLKPNPLSAGSILGKDVTVTPDKTNNSLLITGSRQDFLAVKNLLSKIDIPRDQVFVRVILLDMDVSDDFRFDVNYYTPTNLPSISSSVNSPKLLSGVGSTGVQSQVKSIAETGVLGGLPGAILGFSQNLKFKIGNKEMKGDLFGLIHWLQKNQNATILSRPQVIVMDNEEATIEFGEEVPIGKKSILIAGASQALSASQEYKTATMKLVFTPFISSDSNLVRLKIEQQHDKPIVVDGSEGVYKFTKRNLNSTVIVKSGETAVLGGLMDEEEFNHETKVPLLGDIPIIGWLFKGKSKEIKKRNIFAFLTPQIIRSSYDNKNLLENRLDLLRKRSFSEKSLKSEKLKATRELIDDVRSLSKRMGSNKGPRTHDDRNLETDMIDEENNDGALIEEEAGIEAEEEGKR